METIEILLLVVAGALLIIGLIGSVLPVLPGPPIAYAGILVAHFFTYVHFSTFALVLYGVFTAIIVVVDYLIPPYWVKKAGGTKWGSNGSIIGMLVGLFFFPPVGMLIGTFIGAVIGEMIAGQGNAVAFKSGIATFLGFLTGAVLKLTFSFVILVHFIVKLF